MGAFSQRQVLTVLAAALALSACAGAPAPAGGSQGDARAAVAALVQRYETPTSERFFDLVDSGRFPAYDQFFDRVRQFQINNRSIMLDVVIDGVEANEPVVGVRAHWNKSYVNPQGVNKLDSGECEFMLRRQPSGGFLLTSVSGSSPF